MSTNPIEHDGLAGLEELARRGQSSDLTETFLTHEEIPALAVVKRRDDETVDVIDLSHLQDSPARPSGESHFYDHQTFADHVGERRDEQTTLWAEDALTRITAIFNDHVPGFPGWRDYRAVLNLELDDLWKEWLTGGEVHLLGRREGPPKQVMLAHQDFAEFIEEHVTDIYKPQGDRQLPDGSKMMSVARDFQVKTNSHTRLRRAVRTDSDTVSVHYEPKDEARGGAKGEIEIPTRFMVRVPIFKRGPKVAIEALFRWKEDRNSGDLYLGYKLQRPLEEQRQGFDAIVTEVRNMLAGRTPADVERADGDPEDPTINYGEAPMSIPSGGRVRASF